MIRTRRVLPALAFAAFGCSTTEPSVFDGGAPSDAAPSPERGCYVFCKANQPLTLDVSCMAAKVTSVTLGGVCALDAGAKLTCPFDATGVPFVDCDHAFVFAEAAGECVVSLGFDDGYAYSATVQLTAEPGTDCCSTPVFDPSPRFLPIEELDAGCAADAGDASPD